MTATCAAATFSLLDLKGFAIVDWTLAISAGGLSLAILSASVGLVWKLSRWEVALRADTAEKVADAKLDATKAIAATTLELTKAITALSDKVYQIEIWARDEFVRKGSFEIVVGRMERGLADLRGEITGRLDKMSDKIDHLGSKS